VFAIVGTAGSVILFVCFGVLFVVLAAYGVVVAARAFMVVAQGTAAGLDDISWPDETILDWLPSAFYLLAMLAIWVIPAGLLARALSEAFIPEDTPLRSVILIGLAVWLLFPPGILAMQKAGGIVHLIRGLPALLGFYALTLALFAAVCAGMYLSLFTVIWPAVPVTAAVSAAAVLIYARLLGRLGYMIDQAGRAEPARKAKKAKRVRGEVSDPWATPEEEPEEPPLYAITEEPPAEPRAEKRRRKKVNDEDEPYDVAEAPEVAKPEQEQMRKDEIEREVALRTRTPPEPPASLFFSNVWGFPFHPCSLKAMAWMTFWGVMVLANARLLSVLWPWKS
jgi:hypothetical protein